MSLRSKDFKPQLFCHLTKSPAMSYVPRSEWSKYADGELTLTVMYRIPVLGTQGLLISDQDYNFLIQKFTKPDNAIKFYKQKLASYNARHSARMERFWEENKQYYP